jgi:hypothetical protein
LVAVLAAEMVFVSASTASGGHLTTRHGYERPVASLDDLQVPDDKALIDGYGTERPQTIF